MKKHIINALTLTLATLLVAGCGSDIAKLENSDDWRRKAAGFWDCVPPGGRLMENHLTCGNLRPGSLRTRQIA